MDLARALSATVRKPFFLFVFLAVSAALVSAAHAQTTIVLQQGLNGYTGTTDSKIALGKPTTNIGSDTVNAITTDSSNALLVRFAIFQSEGGPVPNNASIISATLSHYKTAGSDGVFKANRVLKNWTELGVTWTLTGTGATWTTAGVFSGDINSTADGQGTLVPIPNTSCDVDVGWSEDCWLNIDVTAGVQAFKAGTPNFGWKVSFVSSIGDPSIPKNLYAKEITCCNREVRRPKLSITYRTPPIASFTATPASGAAPLAVSFNASATTDGGSPITNLRLQFGDGTPDLNWTDKNQVQTHTYSVAANYTATLTATNAIGTSAPVTQTIVVGGTPPTASFTWSQTGPLTATFNASGTANGSSAITNLRLQFGDGAEVNWTDKTVLQTHPYSGTGPFTATLTATNSFGPSAPFTQTITLTGGTEFPSSLPDGVQAGVAVAPVPTFHSMSLYYNGSFTAANPPPGSKVFVRYRAATQDPGAAGFVWKQGYPLWYDVRTTGPVPPYPWRGRGSVVMLQPNTKYVFELGTGTTYETAQWQHSLTGTTWSETFPEDPAVVTIPSQGSVYVISAGGTASAYKVYDGWNGTSKNVVNGGGASTAGAETDFGTDISHAIVVKANFVIIRRVRATGAATAGIFIAPNVTDVVIEDSQIDDWDWRPGSCCDDLGHSNPNSWGTWGWNEAAGIHAGLNNSRIVIQRNIIKAPHFGSYPWDAGTTCGVGPQNHPAGANGISFQEAGQQNVIRYNEITGDPVDKTKWYQDGIGGGNNDSANGSPGADSDIYQNIIMNVFDDAIEAEGGGRNVRVWGNYLTDTKAAIATTTTHFGPHYAWRNVINRIRACYQSVTDPNNDGPTDPFKYGGIDQGYGGGQRYIFHNTILEESPQPPTDHFIMSGIEAPTNDLGSVKQTTSRNNILHMKRSSDMSIDAGDTATGSSFESDAYNARLRGSLAPGGALLPEQNSPAATFMFNNDGTTPELYYLPNNGPSCVPALGGNGVCSYQLGNQLNVPSKGIGVGEVVPNFSDGFTGSGPDVGAHQRGAPPMKFGISAGP
jgi:PKD repeat protein